MQQTINDIMRLLPHRYPFLLIDRVLEISEDKTVARVLKNVTANEPQFTGHFPEHPIMPGVLIIEAMAQACAVLMMARLTEEERNRKALFYFAGIDGARFKRVVTPGDQLVFECKYIKDRANVCWCECKATVDGELACQAKLMSARRLL
ncbi:MAG: 3-hydroxyacyl-ACP dehydratase FabZ [Duodenibacillus sp.]|nr:3-hydroxyacyl-ACP dehydratase FabZ [Duodenibacillus sp.]